MNDRTLIIQFLSLYQEQIPLDLQNLKNAVLAESAVEIASKAHHIKPTMEYVGAQSLREKLQQLEYAGKNGTESRSIQQLYVELEKEINTLLQEIEHYKLQR